VWVVATHDNVRDSTLVQVRPPILVADTTFFFADSQRLGSTDKTLRWFERSGHAITVDLEKDWLNQDVARWLDAH